MTGTTVLFDLDDTLVVEEAAAGAAFLAASGVARERYGIDPKTLTAAVRCSAGELWRASPTITYCRRIGVSSWEGLWATFVGEGSDLAALCEWAPAYRLESWRRALAEFGVHDAALAAALADAFPCERRTRHLVYPDVVPALHALRERQHRVAVVTNGVPDLQREKLRGAGLDAQFDAVVISGEVGVGKPDPLIFLAAAERLGVDPALVVMVGDSLRRDVVGAQRAGMRGVWLNRAGATPAGDASRPDGVIADLHELPTIVGSLAQLRTSVR